MINTPIFIFSYQEKESFLGGANESSAYTDENDSTYFPPKIPTISSWMDLTLTKILWMMSFKSSSVEKENSLIFLLLGINTLNGKLVWYFASKTRIFPAMYKASIEQKSSSCGDKIPSNMQIPWLFSIRKLILRPRIFQGIFLRSLSCYLPFFIC